MAIIYTYPSGAVKADDLILVSEQDSAGVPTKNITVADLAAYLSGLPGGPWLPLSAGSSWPLTGDLYMAPAGSGFSVGSRNIVFRGIDDVGNELDSARIFTLDSTINPSGQDLYFQNANDVGTLTTNIFVDAFGFVGIGKTNPGANLDIANDLIVGTNVQFGGATDFRYFQGSNSIGLGTSSPNFKFDISGGDLRFENNDGVRFGGTGSNNTNWRIYTTGTNTGTFEIGNQVSDPRLTIYKSAVGTPSVEGKVQFNFYGSGNFTGTAAYNLEVDANGNIIETTGGAIPWPYQYDGPTGVMIQGENPGTTGNDVVGIGVGALASLTSGTQTTAIGHNALANETVGNNTTAIGYYALNNQNGSANSYNVAVGGSAGRNMTSGEYNTLIGNSAGLNLTIGSQNVAIGDEALSQEDDHGDNVAIGHHALRVLNLPFAGWNVAVGHDAGLNQQAAQCVWIGKSAGEGPGGGAATGVGNVGIGKSAMSGIAGGANNVAIGIDAMGGLQTGTNNTAIGAQAMEAGFTHTDNTAIGWRALWQSSSSCVENTVIGSLAGIGNITGNNNTIIGFDAQPSSLTASNEITLGNVNQDRLRFPGSLPAFADDAAAGAGGILTNMLYQTDGAGAAPLNVAGIVMIKQ